MTKKPFHSMSEDFDELEIEPVRMREPDIPDDWLEAETGEASQPRDKSAGEIHMSWLNENSHSQPREYGGMFIERSAYRYAVDQWDYWVEEARKAQSERDALKAENERNRLAFEGMLDHSVKLRQEADKLAEALKIIICNQASQTDGIAECALRSWNEFLDGK